MMIELTWHEICVAGNVAVRRQIDAIIRERQHKHGSEQEPERGLEKNFLGALGEIAVCSCFKVYWPKMGMQFGVVDARLAEVRAVGLASKRLILHPDDRPDVPWVSAVVLRDALPNVHLRGWIMGRDGMQQKYWSDPQGTNRWAYFVDSADLRPMEELLQLLEIAA